jgi:hypothetical protein
MQHCVIHFQAEGGYSMLILLLVITHPQVFVSNSCHSLVSSCGNYTHIFWLYVQKSVRGGALDLILMEVSQVCSITVS